jgi:hypothetical protein
VNHVGLCENGAAARHIGGPPALHTEVYKISQYSVDVIRNKIRFTGIKCSGQSMGLLIDKGSGA